MMSKRGMRLRVYDKQLKRWLIFRNVIKFDIENDVFYFETLASFGTMDRGRFDFAKLEEETGIEEALPAKAGSASHGVKA